MNKQTNETKLIERILANKSEVIKIGLDVHARDVVRCVQEDSSLPQRPQRTSGEQVIVLVRGLVKAALNQDRSPILFCSLSDKPFRSGTRTGRALGVTSRQVDCAARSVPFGPTEDCIEQLVLAPPRTDSRLARAHRPRPRDVRRSARQPNAQHPILLLMKSL
jgi:hypothetical protein